MCLIVSRPADATFPIDQLEVAHFSNPHGVGFMWPGRTRLQVEKIAAPTNFKQVNNLYESVLKRSAGKPLAIHFRWATHGLKDMENTHPYKILDKKKSGMDLYMMHNGIIPRVSGNNDVHSDTWHYIQSHLVDVLTDYPDLIWAEWFQNEVGFAIGAGNKLLFMDNEGRQAFVNYKQGHLAEDTGCWLSNVYSITGAKLHRNNNAPLHLQQLTKPTAKQPVIERSTEGACTVDKITAIQGEILCSIGEQGADRLVWTLTHEHLKGYLTVTRDQRTQRYEYIKAHTEALEDAKLIIKTIAPGSFQGAYKGLSYSIIHHTLTKDGFEILSQLEDGSLDVESSIKDICRILGNEVNGVAATERPEVPDFPRTFTQKVESTRRQRRKVRQKVALPKAPATNYNLPYDEYEYDEDGNYMYESTVPWYESKKVLDKLVASPGNFKMSDETVLDLTTHDLSSLIKSYPYRVAVWLQNYILKI